MINSFYTASSGVIWLQKGLDVTANNIANEATTGYKADKASFSDLLTSNVYANGINDKMKMGNGVKLQKTDTVFTNGSLNSTGRTLDYALQSDGFFAVQTADGVRYTRDGSFILSQNNGNYYLATSSGDPVLNPNGQPIVVSDDQQNMDIGVYTFQNKDGLEKQGNNYFAATSNSGTASVIENPSLRQGMLENSSVDLADEMTNVITSQRAFQMNTKIVQMSDEIMQTINSLRQ